MQTAPRWTPSSPLGACRRLALAAIVAASVALGVLVFFAEPLSARQAAGGGMIVGAAFATAWCVSRGLAISAQAAPSRSTPAT